MGVRTCEDCGQRDKTVTMCQGDLVLCNDCNRRRFNNKESDSTQSATTVPKEIDVQSPNRVVAQSTDQTPILRVNLPPLSPGKECGKLGAHSLITDAGLDTASDSSTTSSSSLTDISNSNQQGVIINELLCFAVSNINNMPHDLLVKILTDFYTEDQIEAAKSLFYELCEQGKPGAKRLVRRKGPNKKHASVTDIVHMLLETPSENIPCFVARDLNNTPSRALETFDLSKLTRDLEAVKKELQEVSELKALCGDLRELVQSAKKQTPAPVTENNAAPAEPRAATQVLNHDHTEDAVDAPINTPNRANQDGQADGDGIQLIGERSRNMGTPASAHHEPTEGTPLSPRRNSASQDSDIIADEPEPRPKKARYSDVIKQQSSAADRAYMKFLRQVRVEGHSDSDSEGFEPVRSRGRRSGPRETRFSPRHRTQGVASLRHRQETSKTNRNDLITGTRHRSNFFSRDRAHDRDHSRGPRGAGKRATGLFVSRLPEGTTARDVETYIEDVSGIRAQCKTLQTKHSGYSSCYVKADGRTQTKLLRPQLWPSGVIVRLYME